MSADRAGTQYKRNRWIHFGWSHRPHLGLQFAREAKEGSVVRTGGAGRCLVAVPITRRSTVPAFPLAMEEDADVVQQSGRGLVRKIVV